MNSYRWAQTLMASVTLCNRVLNVEMIYDTSPGTTTRAAHGGLLIGGSKALNAQAG
jgi:hypothetical protein